MSTTDDSADDSGPDWDTVQRRVAWLVESLFRGKRSAMASAIGFSHTIVARVINGGTPGKRLLAAIEGQLNLNPGWLMTGRGQPFPPDGDVHTRHGIPVMTTFLPGPPLLHQELLSDLRIQVPEIVPTASLYWLVLRVGQPILRNPSSGFRSGDHLLMETDPAKFSSEAKIFYDLCVVKSGTGGRQLRLAEVNYHVGSLDFRPSCLEATVYEDQPPGQTVTENTYRHNPDGVVVHTQRKWALGEKYRIQDDETEIQKTDIVSVWLKILRRQL